MIATIPVGSGSGNPIGIAVDTTSGKVFTANYYSESISVIDENTLSVAATIPDGDYHPIAFGVDSAHGKVYVSNYAVGPSFTSSANGVIIDEASNSITSSFLTLGNARPLVVDETKGLLYIGDGMPNSVAGVSVYQTGLIEPHLTGQKSSMRRYYEVN